MADVLKFKKRIPVTAGDQGDIEADAAIAACDKFFNSFPHQIPEGWTRGEYLIAWLWREGFGVGFHDEGPDAA
jgi:hypothetical protein